MYVSSPQPDTNRATGITLARRGPHTANGHIGDHVALALEQRQAIVTNRHRGAFVGAQRKLALRDLRPRPEFWCRVFHDEEHRLTRGLLSRFPPRPFGSQSIGRALDWVGAAQCRDRRLDVAHACVRAHARPDRPTHASEVGSERAGVGAGAAGLREPTPTATRGRGSPACPRRASSSPAELGDETDRLRGLGSACEGRDERLASIARLYACAKTSWTLTSSRATDISELRTCCAIASATSLLSTTTTECPFSSPSSIQTPETNPGSCVTWARPVRGVPVPPRHR